MATTNNSRGVYAKTFDLFIAGTVIYAISPIIGIHTFHQKSSGPSHHPRHPTPLSGNQYGSPHRHSLSPSPPPPRRPLPGGSRIPPGMRIPSRYGRPYNIIGQFMVIGERVWEIVKEGQPAIKVEDINSLDVLPKVEGKEITAFDMASWSLPQMQQYKVQVKNRRKKVVVDMEYRLFYSYGGTLDGKGSYLAGVAIEPTYVQAKWGVNMDMGVEVVTITNLNTPDDPVPALTFQIRYHVSTYTSASEHRDTYTVVGDGRLIEYN